MRLHLPPLSATLPPPVPRQTYPYLDYFPYLIVNGTITPEFKYVRDVAPSPDHTYEDDGNYNGREAPVYGEFDTKYMTDVRCGRDAFKTGAAKTETAVIEAGSEVGFSIKVSPSHLPTQRYSPISRSEDG